MALFNGLPVYKVKVNEDVTNNEGIDFVSLVDAPAIEKNWVALSNNKEPLKFQAFADKQILAGPILIPDHYIYRNDNGVEYYVVFSAEEIQKLVRKLQAQKKTINLNYQHRENSQVKDAVIQEIWLTGKVDKSQTLGFDLPEGSAFVMTHIGDANFWEKEIKSGNVKGFSIEGFLGMELNKHKFIMAKTDKGIEISSPGATFTKGAEVFMKNEQGKDVPLSDGDHKLDNGIVLKVEAGKIVDVTEPDLTPEEIEEYSKVFSKVIEKHTKPMSDKIAELEVRLSKISGAASGTDNNDNDDDEVIPSSLERLTTLKKLIKQKATKN